MKSNMSAMDSYMNLGRFIRKRNLLAHISIWTIVAIVLTISLTVYKGSLFGIIFLLFFLTFVLIFQSSFSLWARSIKTYCIILVIYSFSISLLTYIYQFQPIRAFFTQDLKLTQKLLDDIGLSVATDDKGWFPFFLMSFAPLSLAILLVIYLRVFYDDFSRFAYLAEEDDSNLSTPLTAGHFGTQQTINDSTFITLNTTNAGNQDTTSDQLNTNNQQSQQNLATSERTGALINTPKTDLRRLTNRVKVQNFIRAVIECFWRILETHFIKIVMFMIFRLAIVDVCLMNMPFLVIVIFALKYPSAGKCSCLTASWLISLIVILRNLSNLSTLQKFDIENTCGTSAPDPLKLETWSYLKYLGLKQGDTQSLNQVDEHITVLLLITIFSFIRIHYERRSVKDYELSFGVIFTGIGRREADLSIINSLKYFCNFGFYKFGIEVTCLTLIIAISYRLDVIAAIYGIVLILLSIITSKSTLASIWPFINILFSLLIPLQYLLRLGVPEALCEPYAWDEISEDFKRWLYLSDYTQAPNAKLLLYDFLVLLAVCRQARVFKQMSINSSTGQIHHDFAAHQFRIRYLPNIEEFTTDDCFCNYTTQSNYVKSIFFISIYWLTLAFVLAAGATKISLFSLGYLIGCFIFLFLGNDSYLMQSRRLIFSWNVFIFYITLVVFIKTILQLVTCYLHQELVKHCYILKVLGVVCYRHISEDSDSTAQCKADLSYDELDILWDGLCLMLLLMQRVVFGSQYFRYLVLEVRAQQILASRGAELVMATQIEEAKAQALYERGVMRSVREKMENLRLDNEKTSNAWRLLLTLPHHHQIIRNANKHLFSSLHDEPASQCRTNDWKFKKAFIPDPLGDELERMSEINGISAVFIRWMKGQPLYGNGGSSSTPSDSPSSSRDEQVNESNENNDDIRIEPMHEEQPTTSGSQQAMLAPAQTIVTSAEGPITPNNETMCSFDMIQESESAAVGRVRRCWDMFNLVIYSCLLSATVQLNMLSRSYRYVSRRMAVEKNTLKSQFNLNDERFKSDPNWRKWVISTLSDTYTKASEQYQGTQSNSSLHRIRSALRIITNNNNTSTGAAGSSSDWTQSNDTDKSPSTGPSSQKTTRGTEPTDPEYHFLKLNIFTQFCRAIAYVFVSNTSLLCQLVIVFNQVYTASLLSLPLPLLTFLWGTLSVPRPTKRFWKTVITYTELVIVVKYVCQFPIWDFEHNLNPFYYANLLGIIDISIYYDLLLLLALFFHRSMLKSLGQWDASASHDNNTLVDIEPSSSTAQEQQDNRAFKQDSSLPNEADLIKSAGFQQPRETSDRSIELAPRLSSSVELGRSQAYQNYLQDSYQNQVQEIKIGPDGSSASSPNLTLPDTNFVTNNPEAPSSFCNCCVRAYTRVRRSITLFFQHVINNPNKVQTDVYTWMFICDFVNFLILIYGFWAFGSGYTTQSVTSFLNENRVPFSVLIMLLLQFASIIVDRSLYLQKNIGGKLMFQVVLVVGIHFWLFFALPFSTGHTLTWKSYWPPKAWYIIKCIYFLLSAHQIRSGYPRRVLGNCFTKGYGYLNWGAFKVYRAIPLVYDLRLYMDWIWTETTLEFRNWSIMEDMFANLFIRKCELTLEEEYPTPRAKPIRRLSKYLTGGAFILLILAIIWGPLLLFSMGKTVGESNPPVEVEYELEFEGFQPILRLKATAQQIIKINDTLYDQLKTRFGSLSSQSFLGDYKASDVKAIRFDGQSNAVWEISPPSKDSLMSRIMNFNETIILKSSWTITRIKREKSQNFDVNINGYIEIDITDQTFRVALHDMLANSSSTAQNGQAKFVETPPIFPNYIRVPETGNASLVDQFRQFDDSQNVLLRPLRLSYIRMADLQGSPTDNSTSWWKAEDLCKYNIANDSYPFWPPSSLDHCDSLVMVAFNDRIFTGILALLSAPGIIGLYTTFVVFFARLIRTEPSGKVIYTEIPKVDRVYGLIMDIYMMRECGEFELEERLFAKLLFLYRSPEMLIEWSERDNVERFNNQDI